MATYVTAGPAITGRLRDLIEESHADLRAAEVTVLCQLAHAPRDQAGEPRGPALKWAGVPALWRASVVSLRDRNAGLADARILLDGDRWDGLHEDAQEAALDGALCALQLLRDKDGHVRSDDCGRPRLRCRPPDFLVAGYWAALERHGGADPAAQALLSLDRELVQGAFEFWCAKEMAHA